MTRLDSVAIVENFWREVWQQPQDPDAIDRLVRADFVITSGGRDFVGRMPFKAWVRDFLAKRKKRRAHPAGPGSGQGEEASSRG